MSSPLLTTKLYIPHPQTGQRLVPRPHLVARLNRAMSTRLTLVSAPAGFGKTTLLTEWIPQSQRTVCWLSLDEADNDLARFLTYFIAALQQFKADLGQSYLEALQSPQPPAVEPLIITLVNELSQTPAELALILDDYHVIQLPAIHSAVAFLLNNLPPNLHLIMTSRADPPLPLARLRARAQLTELRVADLRFTLAEATTFFHQTKELPLPAEQIKELEARTEGWGAGLQLAALSLQGLDAAGVSRFIRDFTGSHHYVFDYLAEDVLHQQPPEIQHFLLHTSILSRLCAPLCDAVLGQTDSEIMKGKTSSTILEYLKRANLFLVPLDDRRHWYRYHHLFADFLRDRLTRDIGQAGVNALYRRARVWHEQHNAVEEAINYALAGRDWAGAVKLTEQLATSLWTSSRYILTWLKTLPEEEVNQSPDLCIWYSTWLITSGEFNRVEKLLDTAERLARTSGNLSPLTGVYVNRATVGFLRDDAQYTFENARQALAYFDDGNRFVHHRVLEVLARGHFLRGELAEAERVWAETMALAQAADNQRTLLFARAAQGELQRARGQLRRAAQLDQELLRLIGERPADVIKIRALARLASLHYEWHQLDQAQQYAHQALELAGQTGREIFARLAYLTLARIDGALGEAEKAVTMIEQAKVLAQRMGGEQPQREVNAAQVRLWLAQAAASSDASAEVAGQSLTAAIDWADGQRLDPHGELPYEGQVTYLALCRVFIARHRPDQALSLLERRLPPAEAAGRQGEVIEMLVLKALAYQAYYQPNPALTTLIQALNLAEPESYIRTFVDEGLPMAQLLRILSQRPSAVNRAYLDTLLAAFPDFGLTIDDLGDDAPSIVNRQSEIVNLVEPLSNRELEILALMAQGLTNGEIAQQIFISAQTVKVHTRNIYGKLGVNSRRQAVTKARALGLLA
ncbi:MAG: helix-turn-helix transcriptional regulator [Anaerolineaceae bacterium]|nr:helix-turn-helix transcriptional regulator [Anaerolineaceae bacterium]MCB9099375.1 helix-turn-helix transcriptional regulator [Anaerolineales bacterium]